MEFKIETEVQKRKNQQTVYSPLQWFKTINCKMLCVAFGARAQREIERQIKFTRANL